MTIYNQKDFSPIFGPDEKPKRKGLYPIYHDKDACEARHAIGNINLEWCDYWDGEKWINEGNNKPYPIQDLYWFGLKAKP